MLEAGLEERLARRRRWGVRAVVSVWRFCRRKPLGASGGLIIAIMVFAAIFAPYITRYDPNAVSWDTLEDPSGNHILGTDHVGRDVFSRIVYGSRVSLAVGFFGILVADSIGTVVGLVSGYFGRAFDIIAQRFVDIFMSIPGLVLLMLLAVLLGQGLTSIIVAMGVVLWPRTARVVRGSVISCKENQYVEAARAVGAGDLRIMILHVLPNILAPIIVISTASLGYAILIEASLSFLGLGVPPPAATWGGMLSGQVRTYMMQDPWLPIFPGVAITLAVLGFNLLGDALRDVLDPRLRGV